VSLLAIDVGATTATALVVTPDGRVAARGRAAVAQHRPREGWVEHAPEELWQAVLGAVREVLAQVDPDDLTALGVSGHRDTVLLWDRETLGSPRRAIAGADRRTTEVCGRLRDAGHQDRIAELSGLALDPTFGGPTLRWLAEEEPRTWALVESGRYAIGTVESYLVARMTRGTWHVSDVASAARTLLLDLATGEWSPELCDVFGVPPDALPDLVPSWGEVAASDPRVFLGLALPVAGLVGEAGASLVGQACLDPGGSTYDGHVLLVGTGTVPVRAGGLLAFPAWRSPAGHLTYASQGGTGSLSGARAVRVEGDLAGDDLWCQRLADRTGVRVERLEPVPSTAALGAAFLAGLGSGVWTSTDELRDLRRPERTFEPGPS
jgi:glycerol kinase